MNRMQGDMSERSGGERISPPRGSGAWTPRLTGLGSPALRSEMPRMQVPFLWAEGSGK